MAQQTQPNSSGGNGQPPQQHSQQQNSANQQVSTTHNNNFHHGFHQMPPGGLFMPTAPVPGSAMYSMVAPAHLPGNVYVNNVTANVNLHGWAGHPGGAIPAYIPQNAHYIPVGNDLSSQGPHILEQPQLIQPPPSTPQQSKSRRPRNGNNNRGGSNSSRRHNAADYNPNNSESSQDQIEYMPYQYQYAYHPHFYNVPPSQMHNNHLAQHSQAQHATGTPLYITPQAMFAGHPAYYHPSTGGTIIYNPHLMHPDAFQSVVDERAVEIEQQQQQQQTHLDNNGMINGPPQNGTHQNGSQQAQIWHPQMAIEYQDEYQDSDDMNHNQSGGTSVIETSPNMLSPTGYHHPHQIHYVDPNLSVEMQHQMNTLHIYDSQQPPPQAFVAAPPPHMMVQQIDDSGFDQESLQSHHEGDMHEHSQYVMQHDIGQQVEYCQIEQESVINDNDISNDIHSHHLQTEPNIFLHQQHQQQQEFIHQQEQYVHHEQQILEQTSPSPPVSQESNIANNNNLILTKEIREFIPSDYNQNVPNQFNTIELTAGQISNPLQILPTASIPVQFATLPAVSTNETFIPIDSESINVESLKEASLNNVPNKPQVNHPTVSMPSNLSEQKQPQQQPQHNQQQHQQKAQIQSPQQQQALQPTQQLQSSTPTTHVQQHQQQLPQQQHHQVPQQNPYPPTKSMSWTNQNHHQKKATASVAVTALPQQPPLQQRQPSAKNQSVTKVPTSPVSQAVSQELRKFTNAEHKSIASAVVPQQLHSNGHNQLDSSNGKPESAVKNHQKFSSTKQQLQQSQLQQLQLPPQKLQTVPPAQQAVQPQINLAPPPSNQPTQTQTGPKLWSSLFVNKSSSISTPLTKQTNNLPTLAQSNQGTKKPVAKVSPYDGNSMNSNLTTEFGSQTNAAGQMSYSAASAQGINSASSSVQQQNPLSNVQHQPSPKLFDDVQNDEWVGKFVEFLKKYKTDFTPTSLRPRGITNPNNYCYINAILQALIGCPPLYNLLKAMPKQSPALYDSRVKTPTIHAMQQFANEFSTLPSGVRLISRREREKSNQKISNGEGDLQVDPAFEAVSIYKLWNDSRQGLDEGRQGDAEEFLSFVLNKLNDEMLEVIKILSKPQPEKIQDVPIENDDGGGEDWQMIYNNRNKGSVTRQADFGKTPISDIFRGELRSRLQREGELSTDVIQPFFTLQLNIEKAASVREALEILVGRDQLEGVTCTKTNQEVVAWQQMNLEKLPVILIFHLKWFDYKLDGCTKIVKTVEFPKELKIDTKILASKKYLPKQKLYRLYAVVYHDGKEANKGHYISDVYHEGYSNWLRYDDIHVKPMSEANVLKPRGLRVPYLLYYRRHDTISQQSQNNK